MITMWLHIFSMVPNPNSTVECTKYNSLLRLSTPVQSNTISVYLGNFHFSVVLQLLLHTQIRTTIDSQVLIHTAEQAEAIWGEQTHILI